MLPMRWDPMHEITTLQREFDDLFRRIFGMTGEREETAGLVTVPAVNSYLKDGVLHLEAELPGVEADQLDVRIVGSEIVIKGERRSGRSEEKEGYLLRESRYGSFARRLALPEGADADRAHAVYHDGLLEITMPVATAKPAGRRLTVEGVQTGKESKEVH